MNIRVLPLEQSDGNRLKKQLRGHCDSGRLQFTTFLTVTDCVLALSQTKIV